MGGITFLIAFYCHSSDRVLENHASDGSVPEYSPRALADSSRVGNCCVAEYEDMVGKHKVDAMPSDRTYDREM